MILCHAKYSRVRAACLRTLAPRARSARKFSGPAAPTQVSATHHAHTGNRKRPVVSGSAHARSCVTEHLSSRVRSDVGIPRGHWTGPPSPFDCAHRQTGAGAREIARKNMDEGMRRCVSCNQRSSPPANRRSLSQLQQISSSTMKFQRK